MGMRVDFQVSDPLTPEGNEKCGHLGVNGRLTERIRCPGHPGRGKQEGEGPPKAQATAFLGMKSNMGMNSTDTGSALSWKLCAPPPLKAI